MGSSLWVKLSLGRPKPYHIFCFVADVRGCIHFLLATVRREFEKRGQKFTWIRGIALHKFRSTWLWFILHLMEKSICIQTITNPVVKITHKKLGVFRLLSFLDFCSRNKLLYRKKSIKQIPWCISTYNTLSISH